MNAIRPTPHRAPAIAAAALALAAAAVLGGCSSSSAVSHSTTTAAGATSAGSASTSASTSASASASSASSSTAAKVASGGGLAGGGDFCAAAKLEQANQEKSAKTLTTSSPAALEKFEKDSYAKLQGFLAIAPSQIGSDVKIIVGADQKLIAALDAVHFDIRKVSEKSLSAFQSPAFTKAVDHVDAYLEKTCGINPTSTA